MKEEMGEKEENTRNIMNSFEEVKNKINKKCNLSSIYVNFFAVV